MKSLFISVPIFTFFASLSLLSGNPLLGEPPPNVIQFVAAHKIFFQIMAIVSGAISVGISYKFFLWSFKIKNHNQINNP